MERSHGGFRALGRVAYQKVVSAAKAPKPMSVLVGSVRTYCRKSASSGIRKYRNSSWACIVLCQWCPTLTSVGREKRHVQSREEDCRPQSQHRADGPSLTAQVLSWLCDSGFVKIPLGSILLLSACIKFSFITFKNVYAQRMPPIKYSAKWHKLPSSSAIIHSVLLHLLTETAAWYQHSKRREE